MSKLIRGFGVLEATALNMSNMIGIGPFITIPLVLAAMGGPQAMLGWLAGVVIALCDGLVWSELGAALPGTGGSYVYLKEAYGPARWGRLMAFLFIWQFLLSGPLEIASGYIGFAQYAGYIWKMTPPQTKLLAAAVGAANVLLLYRRITSLGKITVTLWAGTVVTALAVILSGIPRFNPKLAFDFPPNAFALSRGFVLGLGSATLIAVYDYLGYYDVCYIGEEVKDPGRTIPRSILLSLVCVAAIYFLVYLSVIGVVPWRRAMTSNFVVSDFMEAVYGRKAALVFTALILWTAVGSVFALLLGYSRIPYAAARDGLFFKRFAALHPEGSFPHVSLLAVGGGAIAASFLPLDAVISALMTTRVVVQFVGQIGAVALLREKLPDARRPFKMWLYPLPSLVALAGWAFIFCSSGWGYVAAGLGTLAAGAAVYALAF